MQPRRSTREPSVPDRLGFPEQKTSRSALAEDTIRDTIKSDTIKEETGSGSVNNDFEEADEEPIPQPESPKPPKSTLTIDATTALLPISPLISPVSETESATLTPVTGESTLKTTGAGDNTAARQARALTADLQPPIDYYLLKIDQAIAPVDAYKIRYPRLVFTDHKEFSGNFRTGATQIKAYFKSTGGEAKTIILQHIDNAEFKDAADVLAALDQRFFDHNRVQKAKASYKRLVITDTMTYNQFRVQFTNFATTEYTIATRKYEMNHNYTTLDEFLAVSDREFRNIAAKQNLNKKATAATIPVKIDDRAKNTRFAPEAVSRADTYSPGLRVPRTATATDTCRICKKDSHWARDYPNAMKIAKITGQTVEDVAAIYSAEEDNDDDADISSLVEIDELSGNY
ncbi:uncharacterized protein RAG0_09013 [Rhynchosporium agropyri]|uniref:Uncharacterized protein n=1 Tax=Rhynchosporium agropyri TaxID=914238 RepID=A0A1E1KTB8_9HELO|nr:uncharacterized protein RAG0_09013 [Rhynchosporium agropyri]